MNYNFLRVSLVALLTAAFQALTAQQAVVRGSVLDGKTGESLVGVNVFIEGTTVGVATDIDGKYLLNLPSRQVNIIYSFLGYEPVRKDSIRVSSGNTLNMDIKLGTSALMIRELVVEAQSVRNTEHAVLNLRRKSISIQDAVSAQEIKRSGAGNAAESARQVTGVSIVDGSQVFIRGLGDRYTYTQLNGVTLQSPDPYKNSAQLDLIPSGLLDNIIAGKTFTPDQPGNYTGGSINLTTLNYPEKLKLSFSTSLDYNTSSSFNKRFLGYEGGRYDWLGFDDGTRAIPEILLDKNIADRLTTSYYIKARLNRDTARLLDKASRSLNPEMDPVEQQSFTGNSWSLALGNQTKLFKKQLGFLFAAGYATSYSYYEDGRSASWEAAGAGYGKLFSRYDLEDRQGTQNPRLYGMGMINYRLAKNHELGLLGLYNHDAEKRSRYLAGYAYGLTAREDLFESRVLSFTERSLNTWQLRGRHKFPGLLNASLEWTGGYTLTQMNEPDLRLFANEVAGDSLYHINASTYNLPTHFFRSLHDTLMEFKADITIPIGKAEEQNMIKTGVLLNQKARTFSENNFYYRMAPTYAGLSGERYSGDADEYFGEGNTGIVDSTETGRYIFGNYIINGSNPLNNYTGYEQVNAAYLMAVVKLSRQLKLTAGLRAEHTSMGVSSADSTGNYCWDINGNSVDDPEEDLNGDGVWDIKDCNDYGRINQADILPVISMVYALREDMNLRASATRTIARPTMREMAPFASFDFIGGFIYLGNPALKRSLVHNFDLRWEWYQRPGELLAAGAFYKHFEDPIVKSFNTLTSNPEIHFVNTGFAEVYGLELELRKGLDRLHPKLKQFHFSANFSYIYSRAALDEAEYETNVKLYPGTSKYRPFAGQSPLIVNTALWYKSVNEKTDAGIYYNYAGKRLAEVGQQGLPDSYEIPGHLLGLSAGRKLGKHFRLGLTATNLLNTPFKKVQKFGGEEYVLAHYRTGMSFKIGLRYEI